MFPVGDIADLKLVEGFKADATVIVCIRDVSVSLQEEVGVIGFIVLRGRGYFFTDRERIAEQLGSFLKLFTVGREMVLQTDDVRACLISSYAHIFWKF